MATNIGIHFFDMLTWIFGDVVNNEVTENTKRRYSGHLELKRATVNWFLSLDYDDVPDDVKEKGQRTFRSIRIDGEELEFSQGFTDLHTRSYEQILKGNGFRAEEAKQSVDIVEEIRS